MRGYPMTAFRQEMSPGRPGFSGDWTFLGTPTGCVRIAGGHAGGVATGSAMQRRATRQECVKPGRLDCMERHRELDVSRTPAGSPAGVPFSCPCKPVATPPAWPPATFTHASCVLSLRPETSNLQFRASCERGILNRVAESVVTRGMIPNPLQLPATCPPFSKN